jgi:N-acetylglucosamine malate deacetylase 1
MKNVIKMKKIYWILSLVFVFALVTKIEAQNKQDYKLNIVVIGAHPDDPEKVGGTAYKWIQQGHNVVLVSVTNGNAGHQTLKADELARVRKEESRRAGEAIGAKYIVMDINDAELMPTLENRWKIIRIIREHKADIVITHRPYDYHPDHRYTATLVLDAAYMVTVPSVVPDVPHLERNPVFLYMSDGFTQPLPFKPDICVDIDDAIEKKMDMYHQHTSQMYEWLPFNSGRLDQVPNGDSARRAWLGERRKSGSNAEPHREKLIELYGQEKGSKIRYAESFQDSQYGTRLTKANMKYYFPFFD